MPIFVKVPFLHVKAITLWFIVLWKVTYDTTTGTPIYLTDQVKRHETIHYRQYNETYVVFFLVLYVLDWLLAMCNGYGFWGSYYRIRFEQEAYAHQDEPRYAELRESRAWQYLQVIPREDKS